MKILFLEPFFGGSHKDFALGFSGHSSHDVDLVTLPPRFWKWRMRGAALYFLKKIENLSGYDLIFATDMLDVTDFKALAGPDVPPVVLYFHENQLSYPLEPGEKRDLHLGFTNIISAHAAAAVWFNSKFHLNDFMTAARRLVRQMPDFRPGWVVDEIEAKAKVLYPGCCFPKDNGGAISAPLAPPLIIWNHRWEHDKNPAAFFGALDKLKQAGTAFSLAVLGERYDTVPEPFAWAGERFKEEIRAWGYVESRPAYESWLKKGTLVVSTAIQENFGISVMEAVRYGCFPLLPNRLSYPEIMPEEYGEQILYTSEDELFQKLHEGLARPSSLSEARLELSGHAARFSWETMIKTYDTALEKFGRGAG